MPVSVPVLPVPVAVIKNTKKPQYAQLTTFGMTASPVYDLYKLYASDGDMNGRSDFERIMEPEGRRKVRSDKSALRICLRSDFKGYRNGLIFVDYACVVDMRVSKWLNGLFRKMKENARLDAIEESDDEEDFNDVSENKYTDLDKVVRVRCKFSHRLKKWVPVDEHASPVVAFHRL